MSKDLIGAFVEDMERQLTYYEGKVRDLKKRKLNKNFNTLKDKLNKPEIVISVVGAMKSGKSTFINALLGEDLMPNETEACTFTTTNIYHSIKQNYIVKSYKNGKKEELRGDHLPSVFHEEVRSSRKRTEKVDYHYEVNHPIKALESHSIPEGLDIIITDTPGINEMEGLGIGKEKLIRAFQDAIERTDILLFVIDFQYYKSEETQSIIEMIQSTRPELLDDAAFIVNKIDKRTARDPLVSDILTDISHALTSWGVIKHNLYPISSRSALFSRLIETKSPQLSLYEKEINDFLPSTEMELGGKLVKVKRAVEEAAEILLENSNIKSVETEVFESIIEDGNEKQFEILCQTARKSANASSESIKQLIELYKQSIEKLREGIENKTQQKNQFQEVKNKLTVGVQEIKQWIKKEAAKWKRLEQNETFSPIYGDYPFIKNKSGFHSEKEAKNEAINNIKTWLTQQIESNVKGMDNKLLGKLKVISTEKNFYHCLNQEVMLKVELFNESLQSYIKTMPILKYCLINSKLQVLPGEYKATKKDISKNILDQIESKIGISHKQREYQDTFLLIFTTTKYQTIYEYDLTIAIKFAMTKLDEWVQLLIISNQEKILEGKYKLFPESVYKEVEKRFNDIIIKTDDFIKSLNQDIQTDIKKIEGLNGLVGHLQELNEKVLARMNIATVSKKIFVKTQSELEESLKRAVNGATIYLSANKYTLKQNIKINKTISLIGISQEKTVIHLHHSLEFEGPNHVDLKNITFNEKSKNASLEFEIEKLDINSCSFVGDRKKQYLLIVGGDTTLNVYQSKFLTGKMGIYSYSSQLCRIEKTIFEGNDIGLVFEDDVNGVVVGCRFHSNLTGIELEGDVRAKFIKNNIELNNTGMILNMGSNGEIVENKIDQNSVVGIFARGHSASNITQNDICNNGTGIQISGQAQSIITKNNVSKNNHGGIIGVETAVIASLKENKISLNNESGIFLKDNISIHDISNNTIELNGENGIKVTNQAIVEGVVLNNRFLENKQNGIYLSGDVKLKLKKNKLVDNGQAGVYLEGNAALSLDLNELKGNATGITADHDTEFDIRENHFENNKQFGLEILGESKGYVERNKLLKNQRMGIFIDYAKPIRFYRNFHKEKFLTLWKPAYYVTIVKVMKSNRLKKKVSK